MVQKVPGLCGDPDMRGNLREPVIGWMVLKVLVLSSTLKCVRMFDNLCFLKF